MQADCRTLVGSEQQHDRAAHGIEGADDREIGVT